jgi:phosphomannomutase
VADYESNLRAFGTAGVRGVFNEGQTPEQVYSLALTSAFAFGRGKYGVGWDGRHSSSLLSRVVTSAISAAGSETLLFGLVPTPVTAFGARNNGCKLGFSVTASHNPPEYSGVKVFGSAGMELSKEDETRIERVMTVGARMESSTFGRVLEEYALDVYLEFMRDRFTPVDEGLRVAVDCSNGPGALVTPGMLVSEGHRVTALNAQISSRFPSRLPEPTSRNLAETAAMVGALGVDVGFAHDGDADRLVMMNSSGRVLPDSMVAILAMKAIAKGKGVVILSENSSNAVEEEAIALGLKVIRSRIGKTFGDIDKEGAVFASEPSKVVDPSWGMWEDGMYAAVLICDILARNRELLSLLHDEPKWHFRQVNLPIAVDFEKLIDKSEEELSSFKVSEVRQLDGLKIVFKDKSWIMFRKSGTEPKTRIYCESLDPLKLEELLGVGEALLGECRVRGPSPVLIKDGVGRS